MSKPSLWLIAVYVPESHCEQLKSAMFAAGGGKLGNYTACAWQSLGSGQFQANAGAVPAMGELHSLTRVAEYKLEMLCEQAAVKAVIHALRQAHPYEEPAFHVLQNFAEEFQ